MKWIKARGVMWSLLTLLWVGILVQDLIDGKGWVILGLDIGFLVVTSICAAITVLSEGETEGGTITTFEQGETDTLVSLSKGGLEPVPIPGESDRPPHRLGTDPDCGMCAAIMERNG